MAGVSRRDFVRTVVAIDPAVTSGEDSDETGIIVAARGPHQPGTCVLESCPGHGYVLEDLTCKDVPSGWARRAVEAFDRWDANQIVAEVNNGGDMVGSTIRAIRMGIPYEAVRATKGKLTRAQPASALYEQGRVHHLGSFPQLEDQLTTWTPTSGESPDRLDALVWALTALALITLTGRPVLRSDEEWREITRVAEIEHARAAGMFPKAVPLISSHGIGGDTSWAGAGIIPDDDPEDRPNGRMVRSPFAD